MKWGWREGGEHNINHSDWEYAERFYSTSFCTSWESSCLEFCFQTQEIYTFITPTPWNSFIHSCMFVFAKSHPLPFLGGVTAIRVYLCLICASRRVGLVGFSPHFLWQTVLPNSSAAPLYNASYTTQDTYWASHPLSSPPPPHTHRSNVQDVGI